VKNLYITGSAGSGKIAVALGIALKLKKEGYQVTYFKPVGDRSKFNGPADHETGLMRELLEINTDLNKTVPFAAGTSYLSGIKNRETVMENIETAFREVSQGTDLVIIEGAAFPYAGAAYGLDAPSLAGKFNAAILNIIKFENDLSVDRAIYANKCFVSRGLTVTGHIFNNVPRQLLSKTEGVFKPVLDAMGCLTLGIIPLSPEFASPTVAEFYEVLGGELLAAEDKLDLTVEEVIVGAMTMESALRYMRRSPNKAVILGGDRADLALASLETSTSVLILTGGLYPDVKVVSSAEEKGVPVILVHDDTYTTIEKIADISRHIRPGDTAGITQAVENIERYCDWPSILNSLENRQP